MLKTTKEVVSTTILTIGHTNEEFIWIVPKEGLQAASMFGINSVVQELTERGGKTRAITDITYNTIPFVQEVIDAGVEARHFEGYSGLLYSCLLYTSDAADEEDSVDLGGRRIIKKKKIKI